MTFLRKQNPKTFSTKYRKSLIVMRQQIQHTNWITIENRIEKKSVFSFYPFILYRSCPGQMWYVRTKSFFVIFGFCLLSHLQLTTSMRIFRLHWNILTQIMYVSSPSSSYFFRFFLYCLCFRVFWSNSQQQNFREKYSIPSALA